MNITGIQRGISKKIPHRKRLFTYGRHIATGLFGMAFMASFGIGAAMCPVAVTPPQKTITPDDNTQGLLVYKDQTQTFVLQPSFSGDAQNFGMVLPVPNKPTLQKAPEDIFTQLNNETQVTTQARSPLAQDNVGALNEGVRVIQKKEVGDFSTATLRAESIDPLQQWLDENGYTLSAQQTENMEYYVDKGGFYFVALKLNIPDSQLQNGTVNGKLRPIQIAYRNDWPDLPLRSMAGAANNRIMNFTLYTLGEKPYYVPGSEIPYSRQVTYSQAQDELSSLTRFNPVGDWLVRNDIRIDPEAIQQDLQLSCNVDNLVVDADTAGEIKRVNTRLLNEETGVLPGKRGQRITLSLNSQNTRIQGKTPSSQAQTQMSTFHTLRALAFGLGVIIVFLLLIRVQKIKRWWRQKKQKEHTQ